MARSTRHKANMRECDAVRYPCPPTRLPACALDSATRRCRRVDEGNCIGNKSDVAMFIVGANKSDGFGLDAAEVK